MAKNLNEGWEKRSRKYGTKIEGVLQKSLPLPINKYLHSWMLGKVKEVVPKGRAVKLLDLGCGYGRLSGPLLETFPNSRIIGVDIAQTYVALYNSNLAPRGKAIRGDIRNLPFKQSSFDVVFMVTTLMYLIDKKEQKKALLEIFRVLKKGGKFVIIENNITGYRFVTLGGLISRRKKNSDISSVVFSKSYLLKLIEKCGGKVGKTAGIPVWSIMLPFSLALCLVNNQIGKKFLQLLALFDKRLSSLFRSPANGRDKKQDRGQRKPLASVLGDVLLTFSLYVSYTGVKES